MHGTLDCTQSDRPHLAKRLSATLTSNWNAHMSVINSIGHGVLTIALSPRNQHLQFILNPLSNSYHTPISNHSHPCINTINAPVPPVLRPLHSRPPSCIPPVLTLDCSIVASSIPIYPPPCKYVRSGT